MGTKRTASESRHGADKPFQKRDNGAKLPFRKHDKSADKPFQKRDKPAYGSRDRPDGAYKGKPQAEAKKTTLVSIAILSHLHFH